VHVCTQGQVHTYIHTYVHTQARKSFAGIEMKKLGEKPTCFIRTLALKLILITSFAKLSFNLQNLLFM